MLAALNLAALGALWAGRPCLADLHDILTWADEACACEDKACAAKALRKLDAHGGGGLGQDLWIEGVICAAAFSESCTLADLRH